MKEYYYMHQVGKARHVVNFHDGVKTHKDGSEFYDIKICRNLRNLAKFLKELKSQGYVEGVRPIYK